MWDVIIGRDRRSAPVEEWGGITYTLSAFDDPDIVWEGGKRIEELYRLLKREFDLEDRIRIIQQKVSLISRSSMFVIGRLEGQRSLILEWVIILLILLEVLLVVFGKMSCISGSCPVLSPRRTPYYFRPSGAS